jgi:hypothetical protein
MPTNGKSKHCTLRRYLSPGKLEELASNGRIKAVLDTSSEYSDLDTAQRRRCGSCARSCKVLSRVARASRKVLTKHENELGERAQLLCSSTRKYSCELYHAFCRSLFE